MNKVINGRQVTILIYVDDILVLATDEQDLDYVTKILKDQYESLTIARGNPIAYLGMYLEKVENGFQVSMQSYIEDVLEFYVSQLKKYTTPATEKLFSYDAKVPASNAKKFHTIVAKCLYLSKRARPDILLPTVYLCTRVKEPWVADWTKLTRMLGYLLLTKGKKRIIDNSPFERVTTYIDAAFGVHEDGKGQAGCVVMLGKTATTTISHKLKMGTKSSTDTKTVALSDVIQAQ